MFDYKLENGEWVAISKAKVSYKPYQLVMAILDFVHDNIGPAHSDEVFAGSNAALHKFANHVSYGKDKNGKTIETPDFYRSSVVVAMDYAQSAAFCLAYRKACLYYNPADSKGAKEIEKYAGAMLANFNALFEGKGGKPLPELPTEARVIEPYVNPKAIRSAITERAVEAVVVGLPNLSRKVLVVSDDDGRKLDGVVGLSGYIVVPEDRMGSRK